MVELWKDIKNYEGIYQVSDRGNVRRLTFTNNIVNKEKIHLLKPFDNGKGYLVVCLRKNGTRKNYYVHRLVAEAFCENVNGKKIVNHKDYNTFNNTVDNLEWCDQKENVNYSSKRMKHAKSKCKPTNTGEKYIRKILSHGNYVIYRVYIRPLRIYKVFDNFELAVDFRNEVVSGGI